MAKLLESIFTRYALTEQDLLDGAILTQSNLILLQTDLANTVEQKLSLEFTTDNPMKFAQDEAYFRGQMSIYQLILERHAAAQKAALELARQSAE